ncbi:MAG: ABC transporter permease [Nitrospirae bacterium]|nr:ABC transporter permease [Nitrospirota bacterium]
MPCIFLALMVGIAVFAGVLSPFSFDSQDLEAILRGPYSKHLMGTDFVGRDLMSRIFYGARVSLVVGTVSAVAATVLGMVYGGISGYSGRRIDELMMRFLDVFYSLPDMLICILLLVFFGRNMFGVFLALTLVNSVTVSRVIRGEVLKLKHEPFVEAARATGVSMLGILTRHILPNTWPTLIVTLTFRIPASIITESYLSFVGIGLAPPNSSWGVLANEGWTALRFYPHLILFPSLFLCLTAYSFNRLGDWMYSVFGRS